MKRIAIFFMMILVISSCRSVRKTTVDIRQQKDSVAYSSITTVKLDTTLVPKDSATLETLIGILEGGRIIIEEVKQEQGADIRLDYSVEKTPSGSTKIKVKATTKPREIISKNTVIETTKYQESSDSKQLVTEKKVKGFSLWNLAWVIPLILVGVVIYLKRKTILKYLPF